MDQKDDKSKKDIIEINGTWDGPELMAGLEGSDCWDDPSVWDSLGRLGEPEPFDFSDADLWMEEAHRPLFDDADILGPAELPEQFCPLPCCAWARDGVCVFCLGNWCPNRINREKARQRGGRKFKQI